MVPPCPAGHPRTKRHAPGPPGRRRFDACGDGGGPVAHALLVSCLQQQAARGPLAPPPRRAPQREHLQAVPPPRAQPQAGKARGGCGPRAGRRALHRQHLAEGHRFHCRPCRCRRCRRCCRRCRRCWLPASRRPLDARAGQAHEGGAAVHAQQRRRLAGLAGRAAPSSLQRIQHTVYQAWVATDSSINRRRQWSAAAAGGQGAGVSGSGDGGGGSDGTCSLCSGTLPARH